MCNYKTLFHSELGYAVKCRQCGHIQLAFGTTAMALTEDQFAEFREAVCKLAKTYRNTAFRNQKCIQIPTASKGLMLVYTLDELEQLKGILEAVSERLAKEKLVCLSKQQNLN